MSYEEEKQDRKIEQLEAEIERLRGDNAGLSKAVIDIQEERDLAQAEFRAYHKAWEEQAIEIERLRAELASANVELLAAGELVTQLKRVRAAEIDQAGAAERIYLGRVRLKDARIAELEKWLKKERSARLLEKSGSILLAYLKENEIDFDEFFDGKALEQLQAEGKLGNCDHIVEPDQMGWQVTEERKNALERSAEIFEEDANELEGEEYSGAWAARQKSLEIATVLRAMLKEARQ